MGALVAVLIGVGIAIQVAVLGRAAEDLNPLAVSFGLMIPGVVAAAIWATFRDGWPDVVAVRGTWWAVPLGVGGWLVVAALGYASQRIGVAPTLALSIAAQVAVGYGIDVGAGRSTVDARTIGGLALLAVGLRLLLPQV